MKIDVQGVKGSRYHEFLPLLETPEEGRQSSDIHSVTEHTHQMI